jgi:hypothetical protein
VVKPGQRLPPLRGLLWRCAEYLGLASQASAPVKAFDQMGESPIQGNVTAL